MPEKKKSLLLDFCNLDLGKHDRQELLDLYRKHKVRHPVIRGGGLEREDICCLRQDPKAFYLVEDPHLSQIEQDEKDDTLFLPSHPRYAEWFWPLLENAQDLYRAFLDSCVKGRRDDAFINRLLYDYEGDSFKAIRGKITVKPQHHGWNFYLESYLNDEIIRMFLENRAIFDRIRTCKRSECPRYLFSTHGKVLCSLHDEKSGAANRDRRNRSYQKNRPTGTKTYRSKNTH